MVDSFFAFPFLISLYISGNHELSIVMEDGSACPYSVAIEYNSVSQSTLSILSFHFSTALFFYYCICFCIYIYSPNRITIQIVKSFWKPNYHLPQWMREKEGNSEQLFYNRNRTQPIYQILESNYWFLSILFHPYSEILVSMKNLDQKQGQPMTVAIVSSKYTLSIDLFLL